MSLSHSSSSNVKTSPVQIHPSSESFYLSISSDRKWGLHLNGFSFKLSNTSLYSAFDLYFTSSIAQLKLLFLFCCIFCCLLEWKRLGENGKCSKNVLGWTTSAIIILDVIYSLLLHSWYTWWYEIEFFRICIMLDCRRCW